MDMVVAGYEQHFSRSSRFWRTRFIIIPTEEPPAPMNGSSGERLNDEEVRLAGMDKLVDLFGKARWVPPGDKAEAYPAPHFLPTYLGPAASVCDDAVVTQLEEIHASGPLKKKKNSDKVLREYSLSSIARAMRDEEGVSITDHKWHGTVYSDSFTGADLTSWLVREFSDISTRDQAVEAGSKLHAQGLFEHCRKHHGFLDGLVRLRCVVINGSANNVLQDTTFIDSRTSLRFLERHEVPCGVFVLVSQRQWKNRAAPLQVLLLPVK